MVTCKLFAQLGNQAFMISATIAHAIRMDVSFSFPKKTTAPHIWRTYFPELPLTRPGLSTEHYYKESDPSFNPIPDKYDITIEGYFQSEKYWYNSKNWIANELGFKYQPADYVAIHVRRGDYLKYPDQFPVLPIEYYHNAIQYYINKGHSKFKIYSDDIPWCKTRFITEYYPDDFQYIFSENRDPLSDMKDMYNASAFIIANSTFSLYPALLRVDNPLVIAPADDRWFGPAAKHLNSPDRMPERFIKI